MAKIQNPTKVITGVNTRWSYANVWDAKLKRNHHSHLLSHPYPYTTTHKNQQLHYICFHTIQHIPPAPLLLSYDMNQLCTYFHVPL